MRDKPPSGLGSKQRRFARKTDGPSGQEFLVPLTQDAATYIYVADANRDWPAEHAAKLLYDVTWLDEGVIVSLENIAPGAMGAMGDYQVIETRLSIAIDQPRRTRQTEGFGQVKRLVLLEAIPSLDDLGDLGPDQLAPGDLDPYITRGDN